MQEVLSVGSTPVNADRTAQRSHATRRSQETPNEHP